MTWEIIPGDEMPPEGWGEPREMTPDDVLARHTRRGEVWLKGERMDSGDYCRVCTGSWPCDAAQMAERAKSLEVQRDGNAERARYWASRATVAERNTRTAVIERDAARDERDEAEAVAERMAKALAEVVDNLGVVGPGYPAPVAVARDIAAAALAAHDARVSAHAVGPQDREDAT